METELRAIPDGESIGNIGEKIDTSGTYSNVQQADATAAYKVYTATRSGKSLILKTPNGQSELLLQLLQREYSIIVRLDHPHIVEAYAWEENTPVGPSMVMEQIEGSDLAEWLETRPSRKERERVMDEILDAVEYMHEQGIVHNDLKAANIMISNVGEHAKVIDFGMADYVDEDTEKRHGSHKKSGKLRELTDQRPKDIRSDIYALGVLLRELTGRRYELVVRKCTDPFPERRYANVQELRQSLRKHRNVPRAVAIALAVIIALVVCASVIGDIARYRGAGAAGDGSVSETELERVHKEVEILRDSLATVKEQQRLSADSIARLNEVLTMIGDKETRIDSLRKEFISGAEKLSDKIVKKIRASKDMNGGMRELAQWQTDYPEYCRAFGKENKEEGEEVLRRYSSAENDRLYMRLLDETKHLPVTVPTATPAPETHTGPLPTIAEPTQ